MMKVTLTVLIFLANSMLINAGTNFDAAWSSDCPSGQSIRHISSVHSNWHEDRSWTWKCKHDSIITSSCRWSGYVNSFDKDLLYQCATGVITGVKSYHSNWYEDRKFNFKCCKTKSYTRACYWTGYVNSWDGYLSYTVPSYYYLVGVQSYHSNFREDRRWRFLVC
ncbi:hemagglutinin/amebocyte aggregation factor-like [Dendronephthya gigantea]|uniref:hemagglutinin/amebocyte aggregation factor-like n=1 Tax=Dendronephthya gigantea TaxID=151771 RepID=UPI00106C4142|nr:hemagglutinin/amebocyte aggregation factor-like [Dendronephthya gigantea]